MEINYCQICGAKLSQKEIGDEGFVPYCLNCDKPYFTNPVPSILVAVVNQDNEVLLLQQNYVSTTNWVLVAGYLKFGESLEEAVKREVKEETGLDVSQLSYINSYYYDKKEIIMIGFVALSESKAYTLDSKEVDNLSWVNINQTSALLRDGSIGQKHLSLVIDYLASKEK